MTHSVKNTITYSEEETTTIYAALEVSNRSWSWKASEKRTGRNRRAPDHRIGKCQEKLAWENPDTSESVPPLVSDTQHELDSIENFTQISLALTAQP